MSRAQENSLADAASPYLRAARHQPVAWHPWGPKAFAIAREQDRPILLDIGAAWCHWCHVMDRESYEDAETAALINRHFVAIKVDRDERPDVDSRFQAAVSAISGQGGWPLTVILTPDGKPFFGGTYFPKDDRVGRPALRRVLLSMSEAYRSQRSDVNESAESVLIALQQNETFAEGGRVLNEDLLDELIRSMLEQFDPRHGGFGSQPKFPHAAALDLLLDAAQRPGPHAAKAAEVARVTLKRMAEGGVHDHLGGGFHRYSVDERWIVPHFEKMSYDNSELLRVYTHAFQNFADPQMADVMRGILDWMDRSLTDREQGGFYAAQNADAALGDDGDFYTWTRAEAAAVLSPEELRLAEAHFYLRPVGHMQHDPARNVLYVVEGTEAIAKREGRQSEELDARLKVLQGKLLAARLLRPAPSVDHTLYTGWNGLCISAYLAAGQVLALSEVVSFALLSLHRVLAQAYTAGVGLEHVVVYGGARARTESIPGNLDDHAFLAAACLDAWEATGQLGFFNAGRDLVDLLLSSFYDEDAGGFFDTAKHASQGQLGILSVRRKPIQDAPTPSGNAAAVSVLLRLYALTGEDVYRNCAKEALQAFAGMVPHLGLYAAGYGQALRRFLSSPVQICVLGSDLLADQLATTAAARFRLDLSIVRLRHGQLGAAPPALAESISSWRGNESVAIVCRDFTCLPPVSDQQELIQLTTQADQTETGSAGVILGSGSDGAI